MKAIYLIGCLAAYGHASNQDYCDSLLTQAGQPAAECIDERPISNPAPAPKPMPPK